MQKENYNKLITSIDLIRELYNVNICIFNTPDSLTSFQDKYHFHNAQNAITIENIFKLISDYPDETIYLTDAFMINYLIFKVEDVPIILGPFCSLALSTKDVRTIFNRYHINDLSIKDFFSYYNSYPIFPETHAIHIVEALQKIVSSENQKKLRKITSYVANYAHTDEAYNVKREDDVKLIEKRYSYEQRFIMDIEKGNARSALLDLHNMQADVQYLKKLGTTLESEKIGAAITRTTVRLAAMHANLPIFMIDQLSRNNTIATINAKSVDEILLEKEKMIREFCTAIQDSNNSQYSALVQSMIYYFNHNYYKDITLDDISEELELSKNHIIMEFKKGTGITPMNYLRKIRLRQASVLLTGTNLSIQEVSESVGIPDTNYFIKLFKKKYGATPHLYRKQFSYGNHQ